MAGKNGRTRVLTRTHFSVLGAMAVVSTLAAAMPAAAQAEPVPVVSVEEVRTLELDDIGIVDPAAVAVSPDGRSIYVVDDVDRQVAVEVDFAEQKVGDVALTSELAPTDTLGLAPDGDSPVDV
ncbi:MAG: hypothetical protein OES24_19990, partial [Acidimicrobiia bacterium]|nr:hypothetical protein [Acidimicrobiia bacterium]